MNDIKKQRIKRVDDIATKVTDGYQNEMLKKNYNDLRERQQILLDKVADNSYDEVTRGSARLQLKEIGKSLQDLQEKIDWSLEYDVDCDDKAARQFIEDNNLLEDDSMIKQNDALDELERKLYHPKQGD